MKTVIVALAGLVLAGSVPVLAQEPAGEVVPSISLRETAAALARSGAANSDPRKVLAAAQVLITAERASAGVVQIGGIRGDTARREEISKAGEFNGAGLLRLASRIAIEQQDAQTALAAAELAASKEAGLGDAALSSELMRAATALAGTRGAAGGPIWSDGYLGAGASAEFKITFEGGYAPNSVNVSASSQNGDIDCYLYEGSQLVARDAGYAGNCSIKWTQRMRGTMTLRLRNTGAATYYTIVSN